MCAHDTEKGEKLNVMGVLIDEHAASSGRSLSTSTRALRRDAQNVSFILYRPQATQLCVHSEKGEKSHVGCEY
jgi:hypothetical protein